MKLLNTIDDLMFKNYISLKGKLMLILLVIFEKNGALINEKMENGDSFRRR